MKTLEDLKAMKQVDVNLLAAKVRGWPRVQKGDPITSFPCCSVTRHDGTVNVRRSEDDSLVLPWTPLTDANQAIEFAEHVRKSIPDCFYQIGSDMGSNKGSFGATFYNELNTYPATDDLFSKALTFAALLAADAMESK